MTVRAGSGAGSGAAFGTALGLDLAGAAGALLSASRTWQTVRTPRPAPRPPDVLQLAGRTVDAAPTALALVALAGVVAVLAGRGVVRRAIGALLVLDGLALVWLAVSASGAVGLTRARELVTAEHETVDAASVVPTVSTHLAWPVLTVACGVLVVTAGALITWRGHRWQVMAARYERRPEVVDASADPDRDAARAAATMWTALDRGDDPTAR